VARDRIELPTQGFSGLCSTDDKDKISNSLPTEGVGNKSEKSFKEITRKTLKKRRKK
jgi:hypothetical protein